MFHPGETVSHTFIIPFIADELSKVVVTYKQNDHVIITKQITSGFEPYQTVKTQVVVPFTQSESLLFEDNKFYSIQLNVITVSGARATSNEIKGQSGVQHYKEVIPSE